MGNNQKYFDKLILMRQKYGELELTLEKTFYKSGEQINGFIYMDLKSAFPTNSIKLILKGKERVKFFYNEIQKNVGFDFKGNKIIRKTKKNILTSNTFYYYNHVYEILLKEKLEIINPGIYKIPFSILWDKDLPGSFEKEFVVNEKNCYAMINYYFILSLNNTDNNEFINSKKYYFIIEKPIEESKIYKMDYKILKIPFYWFCNNGDTKLKLEIESDPIFPGQDLDFRLSINTKKNIEYIKIILNQILNLNDNNGHSFNINFRINSLYLGKIEESKNDYFQDIYFSIKYEDLQLDNPKIKGKLISNNYEILLKLKNGICSNCINSYISIPINISYFYDKSKINNINLKENEKLNRTFIYHPKVILDKKKAKNLLDTKISSIFYEKSQNSFNDYFN